MKALLIILVCSTVWLTSCTTTNLKKYYFTNHKILDDIEIDYKEAYSNKPFSIEYADNSFKNVSIEIITDSIKLIYGFLKNEPKMNDTLLKYNLKPLEISHLLSDMRSIGCIWINKLDYYLDGKKNLLIFMSIRQKKFHFPLSKRKYYILSYFQQPQYFDEKGNLLNKRKQKLVRKIHGDVFKRLTDKVAYTISDRFR